VNGPTSKQFKVEEKMGEDKKPIKESGNESIAALGLCAVLTYEDKGIRGICGQTVGADGRGTKAIIFEAETADKAATAAYAYIREMESKCYPGQISECHLVYGEDYFGMCIKKISA